MRMENFVKNIKQDIEVEIQRIEQQDIDILDKIKQIVGFIQTSLARLKVTIADYQFINPEEEILFFKVRKPQISGLLIFISVCIRLKGIGSGNHRQLNINT